VARAGPLRRSPPRASGASRWVNGVRDHRSSVSKHSSRQFPSARTAPMGIYFMRSREFLWQAFLQMDIKISSQPTEREIIWGFGWGVQRPTRRPARKQNIISGPARSSRLPVHGKTHRHSPLRGGFVVARPNLFKGRRCPQEFSKNKLTGRLGLGSRPRQLCTRPSDCPGQPWQPFVLV